MLVDPNPTVDVLGLWPFLALLSEICRTLFFVVLTICLVSILDWQVIFNLSNMYIYFINITNLLLLIILSIGRRLDLAHADLQHVIDTFQRRKIGYVFIVYFCAMAAFLVTAPTNDFIIYTMLTKDPSKNENFSQKEKKVTNPNISIYFYFIE